MKSSSKKGVIFAPEIQERIHQLDCLAVSYICYVLVFKLYLEVFIRLFC